MLKEKITDEIFILLATIDEIIPEEIFSILNEYVNYRKEMMGSNIPVYFFLKYPYTQSVSQNSSIQKAIRYNPLLKEKYEGDNWGPFVNAYRCDDGIYIDFPAIITNGRTYEEVSSLPKGKISGLKKAEYIIDLIFTLEHELQHEKQNQNFNEKPISLDAWKYLKDCLVIGYFNQSLNVKEKMFYHNSHGDFFIEEEANEHAYNYIREKIAEYGMGENVVTKDNNQSYTIIDILEKHVDGKLLKREKFVFDYEFESKTENSKRIETFDTQPENIISFIVDDIVFQNPEYVEDFPVFQLEYNLDGTRKTYSEIREWLERVSYEGGLDFDGEKISFDDVKTLCDGIFNNSPLLNLQKLEFQLELDLFSVTETEKASLIEESLTEIIKLIANENFYPDNALRYLDNRKKELEHMSRVCYDKKELINNLLEIFETLKRRIMLKFKEMNEYDRQEEAKNRRNSAWY